MIKLPVITRNKDIEIKSVNGQSVFHLREQILTILDRELNSNLILNFFAEPVVNEVKGEVSWYTSLQGQIRSFSELSADDRGRVSGVISDVDQQLKNAASKIAKSGPQAAWLADAIRAMLYVPDLNSSLFIVGENPVLAQWGCVPFGSDPAGYEIILQNPIKNPLVGNILIEPIPASAEGPAIEETSSKKRPRSEPQSQPEAINIDEPPIDRPPPELVHEPSVEVADWRRYFPGIWILLLLLLLIVGLLLNYFYRSPNLTSSIEITRGDIDRLWGNISERAEQCENGGTTSDLSTITPQKVEGQLEGNSGIQISQNLNISLAWKAPVDLDLAVKEPNSAMIDFNNPTSQSSGRLDIDANRTSGPTLCAINTNRDPIENISWANTPTIGTYNVSVRLYSLCGLNDVAAPIPFKLMIKKRGGPVQEIQGEVSKAKPVYYKDIQFN